MSVISPYEHKVCYYETDCMRIVHHSNYLRWFEESRVYFLDAIGYSYARMESLGVLSPVLGAFCDYKSPARFGDTVLIFPKLNEFNGFKFSVSYEVIGKESGALLATGGTRHCFADGNMRPIRTKKEHPDIYEAFKKLLNADVALKK